MARLTELMRHPGEVTSHAFSPLSHRPKSTAGVVLLALALIGFAYMWPELHRYLRVRRM